MEFKSNYMQYKFLHFLKREENYTDKAKKNYSFYHSRIVKGNNSLKDPRAYQNRNFSGLSGRA